MSNLNAKEYKTFEGIKHKTTDGVEFWLARELSSVLQYNKWENFAKVIDRAMIACKNSGYEVLDHFPEVRKMVDIGSDTKREIKDYELTRYACYLIVQNGDPRKEIIALGQTYFAIQTRRQENLPTLDKSISQVEREQIQRLKKSKKKLMLDE